jgi:integrase
MGKLSVQAIDTALVLKVLEPIWTAKPETAGRVRGRIESVLDWATAREYRQGENPARWRGHLCKLLPARDKVRKVEHHPALPYAELSGFLIALREQEGIAARALEFAVLTAARTGETIGARWPELDLLDKTWTVPAERMKAGREHRVPLSAGALAILQDMQSLRPTNNADAYVFPGGKIGKSLSNMAMTEVLRRMNRGDITVHGFRSTFRDWAAERTNFPAEVAEMALAHTVSDKTVAAYKRSDLFERRRRLMTTWATFCTVPVSEPQNNVAPIRQTS